MDPTTPLDQAAIEERLKGLDQRKVGRFWRLYRGRQVDLNVAEVAQRRELRGLFRAALEDLNNEVRQSFDAVGVEKWDLATMRRTGRQDFLFRQIVNRIEALGGQTNGAIERSLVAQFKRAYAHGAYSAQELGANPEAIRFGIIPDQEILGMLYQDYQGANFSQRLGIITDDMAHRIQQGLMRSMIDQESWLQAAKRIRGEMGTSGRAATSRAEMIARTELRRASSLGGYQFRLENEEAIGKTVWLAHAGACPVCVDLDGRELDGPEDYPPALSHPNCTCTYMDLPIGQTYGEFGQTDQPQQTFKDWAADHGATGLIVGGTE